MPAGSFSVQSSTGPVTRGEVRVVAAAVGARLVADVGRGGSHHEPGLAQAVVDRDLEPERVAGEGIQPVRHDHPAPRLLDGPPRAPPQESVDGIVQVGFGQRHLVVAARERVAAVGEPVGPGHQDRPVGAVAHGVGRIGVEHGSVTHAVVRRPPRPRRSSPSGRRNGSRTAHPMVRSPWSASVDVVPVCTMRALGTVPRRHFRHARTHPTRSKAWVADPARRLVCGVRRQPWTPGDRGRVADDMASGVGPRSVRTGRPCSTSAATRTCPIPHSTFAQMKDAAQALLHGDENRWGVVKEGMRTKR